MKRLRITHTTRYEYANPVLFGPHRLMIRPRDSHDLRLLSAMIDVAPAAKLVWYHDVFGNSIAQATFSEPAATLTIVSALLVESYAQASAEIGPDAGWLTFPLRYDDEDAFDLGGFLTPPGVVSSPELMAWTARFTSGGGSVLAALTAMSRTIRSEFRYEIRHEENTRRPEESLWRRSGSCRDFAALFVAGARQLGIAARFVSGYLFASTLVGADSASTHAWAEVFLPGIGWIEFDPTNVPRVADRRIRVAVAREAWQALPVAGSFTGATNDFIGLWVGVSVAEA